MGFKTETPLAEPLLDVEGGAPGSPGSARAAVERRAKEREAKQAKLKAGHIRPGKNSWTLIETKMGPVTPPLAETWIKTWKKNTKTNLKTIASSTFLDKTIRPIIH